MNLQRKRSLFAVSGLLASTALTACVAGSGSSGGEAATGVTGIVVTGGLNAKNPEGKSVQIDYSKADVTVVATHKQTAENLACVPSLTITLELPTTKNNVPVHMCKLELGFTAGFAGEGLLLTGGKFHARQGVYSGKDLVDTVDCAPWATTEPAKGEVIYDSIASQNPVTVGFNTIPQPYANQVDAVVSDALLQPSGTATFKFKGRQFSVDLSTVSVKGDIQSKGDPNVSCAKSYHDLPTWQLPDVNPKSPGHGATYGLEAFHGKRIILDMGAGWCGACIAEAGVAEKIIEELSKKSRTDVAFVSLCDPSQPEKMAEVTSAPLLMGDWNLHAQVFPDGTTRKGAKSDAFAYDYDGRFMGYFEGADTVYTNYYEDFLRHVVDAPKDKPDFIFCANGGWDAAKNAGSCVISE